MLPPPRRLLGVLCALVIAGVLVSEFLAWRSVLQEEAALNQRWMATLIPLVTLPRMFPVADGNGSSRNLEDHLLKIGMFRPPQFVTLEQEQAWKASHPAGDVASIESVMPAAWSYVEESLRSANDEIAAPPGEVVCLLDALRGDLEALSRGVLEREMPRWRVNLRRLSDEDPADSDNLRQVVEVLIADSLDAWRRESHETAMQDLAASWRIAVALLERPETQTDSTQS